jgi:hypothetical protein
MRSLHAKHWLIAGGVLVAALPALAIAPGPALPPGFGDPVPVPPPTQQPPPPPTVPTPDIEDEPPAFGEPQPAPRRTVERARPVEAQETVDSAVEDLEALPPPQPVRFYDLPQGAQRPVDIVGVIGADNRGLPIDAFGSASGPWLRTLMQRLDAPIPSRWTSILLRRALMSRVSAPRATDPVDGVGERTACCLRMGERYAARYAGPIGRRRQLYAAMVGAAYERALATSDRP